MADPVPGVDFGVPWPPVTNPDTVAGCSTVGGMTAIPPGPPAPLPTTPTTPPLNEVPLSSVPATVAPTTTSTVTLSVDPNPLASVDDAIAPTTEAVTNVVDPSRVVGS